MRSSERQRERNGEWKRKLYYPIKMIELSISNRGYSVNTQGTASGYSCVCGVCYIWRIDERNSVQVQNGACTPHFSQGQAEGQVTLAIGNRLPRADTSQYGSTPSLPSSVNVLTVKCSWSPRVSAAELCLCPGLRRGMCRLVSSLANELTPVKCRRPVAGSQS